MIKLKPLSIDFLVKELEALEKDYPEFKVKNSPTERPNSLSCFSLTPINFLNATLFFNMYGKTKASL